MNILMIGDVVGKPGCDYLSKVLPKLKQTYHPVLTVVNGENSAVGNGILPQSADAIFQSGADVITGGNHSFRRREIQTYIEEMPFLLRPANFPPGCWGNGYCVVDCGKYSIAVISLMGQIYMDPLSCPFRTMDRILETVRANFYIVDFHAEATGEKLALAYYLDGRVSVVAGTHTHVQTADETILEHGTGYLSDLGMVGPIRSILGVTPENIVEKMTTHLPTRFVVPDGPCKLNGAVFTLDPKTGKCTAIERIQIS